MLISPSFTYANCCVDNDDDGYADPLSCPKGTDCNDNDEAIFRGSVGCENCKDVDGDRYLGYDPDTCSLGTDCDDFDAEKNPRKGNCGKCEDKDNDGYFAISESCPEGNDCNDDNSNINPAPTTIEVCGDGVDNNCGGNIDENCVVCIDVDGDGYYAKSLLCPEGNDCDDDNSNINPAPTTIEVCGDGVDNNCGGNIDECCNKVLNYNSGNNQEGLICEGLTAPFEVKVADNCGNPKSGIGVEWNVTSTPKGSQKAGLSNSSVVTSQTGVASTYFTLGNYQGDYTVKSSCSVCSQGSPQTFIAKANCPVVPKYYQSDYPDKPYDKWCKYTYTYYDKKNKKKKTLTWNRTCLYNRKGNLVLFPASSRYTVTQYTIAQKGCALTSVSMVLGSYNYSLDPPTLDALFKGYKGYDKGGVDWNVVDRMTNEVAVMFYNSWEIEKIFRTEDQKIDTSKSIPLPVKTLDSYLNRCMPVIVRVKSLTTESDYWVVVTGRSGDDYTINDPNSKENDKLSAYGNIFYSVRVYKDKYGGCQ